MNDNRYWMIIGRKTQDGFTWLDDIEKRDNFSINDVVYVNGAAMLVSFDPYERYERKFVDVTDEYIEVCLEKIDADWAEYCDLDDTYEDVRRATR